MNDLSKTRFTRDGSDALEALLRRVCVKIGERISNIVPKSKLQALLLAGGYGRGEGGVLETAVGDAPYNDLEFFLLIKGSTLMNERSYGSSIHQFEHEMTDELGIEVEFKIISLEALISSETSMFYYDLVAKHVVVVGDQNCLDRCAYHADAVRIPAHEATRLMMNRCSGLLFAQQRLEKDKFSSSDADFVARNIAKAQLAMGDAILAILGQYHWSCLQRHQLLKRQALAELPMDVLQSFHADGVSFKLHPKQEEQTYEALKKLHAEVRDAAWVVWCWIEQKRLGHSIDSPRSYMALGDKCAETLKWKNFLIRLRTFGIKGVISRDAFLYPRCHLLHVLPLLLWSKEGFADLRLTLTQQLRSPIENREDAISAYHKLWERFN